MSDTTTQQQPQQESGKDKPRGWRNRVWIELERPSNEQHAAQIVTLANNMLRRLSGENVLQQEFGWDEGERQYWWGGPMGAQVLLDNGHWFNLDYLGRTEDPTS